MGVGMACVDEARKFFGAQNFFEFVAVKRSVVDFEPRAVFEEFAPVIADNRRRHVEAAFTQEACQFASVFGARDEKNFFVHRITTNETKFERNTAANFGVRMDVRQCCNNRDSFAAERK